MSLKRLLYLLSMLALVFAIAACGGAPETAVEEASEAVEEAVEEVVEDVEEAVEEMAEDAMFDFDKTGWPEEFVIGVFAGDDSTAALEGNEPLRAYLEKNLGIPVTAETGTSYSAVIEAMRAGRVDAMQVGPFSFVLAEREAGAIPLAANTYEGGDATAFDENVFPYYFSVFVTKKGSGIATFEDLEGVDFAFVDPASTSGRNAPAVRLINEIDGLETPADVDEWMNTTFAGSHPSAITALWNDKVQAAATYEGNLINLREEGLADVCGFEDGVTGVQLSQEEINAVYEACPDGSLVVIAQSDPIPNTPFAVSPDLPENFRNAVQEVLLSTAQDQEFIDEAGTYYLDPSTILNIPDVSSFYDVVRDIARVTIDEEGSEAAAQIVDKSDWPEEFVMGLFAGDDSAETLNNIEPLRSFMEENLGIPVTAETGTSYSAVIEAMRAGRVDAMMVGPFSFVLAEREAGAIPLAPLAAEAETFSEDIFPYYFSVFVVKKGSGIQTLEDLEGVDFAFVDPASTSGRNAPAMRLINEIDGLETPADVDEWMNTIFAGSHPSAITALWNDKVAGAVTYEGNLINLRAEGQADVCGFEGDELNKQLSQAEIDATYEACPDGSLVVIAQSDPIPNTPFAVSPDLPESMQNEIQRILFSTKDDPEFIASYGRYFLDPTTILDIPDVSSFYDVVRQMAAVTIDEAGAAASNAVTDCPVATTGEYTGLSAEGATVEWWVNHSGSRLEGLEEILADFNAENACGIEVVANNIGGYGDISTSFNASVAAGEVTSQLIVGYQNDQAGYQLNDALVDINLLIADEGVGLSEDEFASYYASFMEQSVHPLFGGQRLGFAPNRSVELLHYNATYLEELGFSGPPTTPEEFVEMACAAAEASESGQGGFVLRDDASALSAWTFAFGGSLLTADGTEYVYNSQATIDAANMIQELATEGEDGLVCAYFFDGFPNPEVAGRNALFAMGSSSGIPFYAGDFATINEETGREDVYAVAAIPHTTADPVINIYGGDVMIPRSTPEQELAAWEFVKWFTAPENQARWVEISNYFPTNAGTVEFIDEYIAANPVYGTAVDLLQYGAFEPQLPSYFPVRGLAEEAFNAIMLGADVEETLNDLNDGANELQEEIMAEIEG